MNEKNCRPIKNERSLLDMYRYIRFNQSHYECDLCGSKWSKRNRYQYWPIHLGWKSRRTHWSWFSWHGWQIGWDAIEQRVYGWTFHIGPLLIIFGKDRLKHEQQSVEREETKE